MHWGQIHVGQVHRNLSDVGLIEPPPDPLDTCQVNGKAQSKNISLNGGSTHQGIKLGHSQIKKYANVYKMYQLTPCMSVLS